MSEHAGRQGTCFLAWGSVIVIVLGLIFGIVRPWLGQIGVLEHEIESLDDQMGRYHRLLQTLPGLETELEQASNNTEVKDFYFNAKTPALAGAEMQREVQKMVEAAGGRVTSTQLLRSDAEEQPPTVRVRTQIQGTTDALFDVLYQIEQARPFLFVDQLSVRAPAQRRTVRGNPRIRGRQRSLRRQSQPGMLTIRLDVFGYALGKATP